MLMSTVGLKMEYCWAHTGWSPWLATVGLIVDPFNIQLHYVAFYFWVGLAGGPSENWIPCWMGPHYEC